jgi:hypothetical protein
MLCLLGVLAGCESWVEIAKYGEKKLGFPRRFRPFTDGTPSHDQLGDIFAVLDAEQFQHCFIAWTASLTGQGQPPDQAPYHGMGRRLPRKPYLTVKIFTRFPWGDPSLKRHWRFSRNRWKWCLRTPLNFLKSRFAWFQKVSIPFYGQSRLKRTA